jgi:putative zinc finger/helix-turn-helix YgiT family protein
MRGVCPNCERVTELSLVPTMESFSIRGEQISVAVDLYKCGECGAEFENPAAQEGPVERAYREYRKRKGLLHPEEIRDARSRFGLTQSELGKLLGFGGATISRYENGALQDEAHDRALRLAFIPRNLIQLMENAADALPESKRSELVKKLREEDECSSLRLHIERLGSYSADTLSGFKSLDYVKFQNLVLFFCKTPTFTTVLNKLLFYSDFLHFKKFAVSISGTRYAHMPFGPAPDKYRHFFALLEDEQLLETNEVTFDGGSGETFLSREAPDLHVFEDSELRCMLFVKSQLERKSATEMSRYSHEEVAYKETRNGELISYSLAESLSLELE